MIKRGGLLTVSCVIAALLAIGSARAVATQSATTPTAPRSTGNAEQDVRTAARAWSKVFLTGTLKAIRSMQGPECAASNAVKRSVQRAYLERLREVMRRTIGVDLDDIEIVDIELRNVTPSSGEAQVTYNLPTTKAGNDNWVEYRLHEDGWQVANCHAPIGGQSVSVTTPQ